MQKYTVWGQTGVEVLLTIEKYAIESVHHLYRFWLQFYFVHLLGRHVLVYQEVICNKKSIRVLYDSDLLQGAFPRNFPWWNDSGILNADWLVVYWGHKANWGYYINIIHLLQYIHMLHIKFKYIAIRIKL